MDEIHSGVDDSAAAEQEPLFTKEDFMEDAGVEEPVVAEQEEPEVEAEETQEETVEKAFAERLKHATKKIREEVKDELMREFSQQQTPQVTSQEIPPLPQEEAERMADQYGSTPEMIRALYTQQAIMNRQNEMIQKIAQQTQERDEYSQARNYAEEVRKANPAAPEWDERKLKEFREDYQKQYGTVLTWRDTYRQLVAEEALNPATYQKIARAAQQETIKKITSRDKDTVQIKGQTAKKPSISDLADADFERLIEEAKEGKFI